MRMTGSPRAGRPRLAAAGRRGPSPCRAFRCFALLCCVWWAQRRRCTSSRSRDRGARATRTKNKCSCATLPTKASFSSGDDASGEWASLGAPCMVCEFHCRVVLPRRGGGGGQKVSASAIADLVRIGMAERELEIEKKRRLDIACAKDSTPRFHLPRLPLRSVRMFILRCRTAPRTPKVVAAQVGSPLTNSCRPSDRPLRLRRVGVGSILSTHLRFCRECCRAWHQGIRAAGESLRAPVLPGSVPRAHTESAARLRDPCKGM